MFNDVDYPLGSVNAPFLLRTLECPAPLQLLFLLRILVLFDLATCPTSPGAPSVFQSDNSPRLPAPQAASKLDQSGHSDVYVRSMRSKMREIERIPGAQLLHWQTPNRSLGFLHHLGRHIGSKHEDRVSISHWALIR